MAWAQGALGFMINHDIASVWTLNFRVNKIALILYWLRWIFKPQGKIRVHICEVTFYSLNNIMLSVSLSKQLIIIMIRIQIYLCLI